jgi:hypothetical protein
MHIQYEINHRLRDVYENATAQMESNRALYRTILEYNFEELGTVGEIDTTIFMSIRNAVDVHDSRVAWISFLF